MNKTYKGYNGNLVITENGVLIQRGAKGFFGGGGYIRGDKQIPFSSIVAVQYKKNGLTAGYLQLTLRGGSEAKAGVFEAVKDENTVSFQTSKTAKQFHEAKEIIESQMNQAQESHTGKSGISELEQLADLKDKGILTEEEFATKKKQILGL